MRAAAVARRVYLRPGTGVGGLRKAFGMKDRNGTHRGHFVKASGGLIRHILIQLDKKGLTEKAGSGRKITSQGQQALDQIAHKVRTSA